MCSKCAGKITCAGLFTDTCADPERFVIGGSNFDNVFFNDEGRKDPNTTISGPSSARQQNAI